VRWLGERMKIRYVLVAILVVAVGVELVRLYGGSQVPAGQPELQALTSGSVGSLEEAFNADAGDVRILALLSPT
jgi:hypothetical protein